MTYSAFRHRLYRVLVCVCVCVCEVLSETFYHSGGDGRTREFYYRYTARFRVLFSRQWCCLFPDFSTQQYKNRDKSLLFNRIPSAFAHTHTHTTTQMPIQYNIISMLYWTLKKLHAYGFTAEACIRRLQRLWWASVSVINYFSVFAIYVYNIYIIIHKCNQWHQHV